MEKAKKTITILATEFKPTKMHIYDVKTTGRHPVHVIDGGSYITESEEVLDESSDLGWFFLNQKEYDYFKSQLREMEFEIE